MIHVQQLTIHEFRGIRHLTLDLNGKNFAVCGPNGTGKSGVVDALEFVLTGTVSRLTGRGRGDLSVREHGPHVDSRLSPEKAYVEAVITIPSLGKTVTVRRTVKAPRVPTLTPDTEEVRQVLAKVELHPEIALSRREIIRYVLTEPGQRSKDVQALLKLDELEGLRATFQKIANAAETDSKRADRDKATASDSLTRALQIAQAKSSDVLAAANERRKKLSLEPLTALTPETSLRDGLATAGEHDAPQRINKATAIADVQAVGKALDIRNSPEFASQVAHAIEAIERLQADAALLNAVLRDDFLKTALELYDGEACPACDAPHTAGEFTQIINAKRVKLAEVKELRASAEARLAPVVKTLDDELSLFRQAFPYAKPLLDEIGLQAITDHGGSLKSKLETLRAFLPLDATLTTLRDLSSVEEARAVVDRLAAATSTLPEPSEQDAARDYLTIGQERLEALRAATAAHRVAQDRAATARRVFDIYSETSRIALEKVYQAVQGNFADLYRRINADDESAFKAELIPSMGKLGFNVDFYKRGFFPPGAYHSEGHQDSMGLCLYLALVKHLLGDGFTFSVLDDVLMSVDAGHRREVSRLLKAEFPNTQFVLTTHDKAWLKHMGTAGLIDAKNAVHFRKWSVDDGPSAWAGGDIWAEIVSYAQADDVRAAAGLLRHYLEHLTAEYCQVLRAKVEFSADGRHDLGDLLQPAVNQLKALLSDNLATAESWADAKKIKEIGDRQIALADAAKAALGEQWQINPAIHYNEWANLHKNDFLPLVEAFRVLTGQFNCSKCGGLLEVTPSRGSKEHLLCECGEISFGFKRKPKDAAPAG